MDRVLIAGLQAAPVGPADRPLAPLLASAVDGLVERLGAPGRVYSAGPRGLGRHAAIAAGLPFDADVIELAAGGLGGLDGLALALSGAGGPALVCAVDHGGEPAVPVPAPGLAWRTTLLERAEADAIVARRAGVDASFHADPIASGAVALVLTPPDPSLPSRGRIATLRTVGVDPALGAGAAIDAAIDALFSLELPSTELDAVACAGLGPGARLALAQALDHDPETLVLPGADTGAVRGLAALLLLLEHLEQTDGRLGLLAAGDDMGRGIALVVDTEPWA